MQRTALLKSPFSHRLMLMVTAVLMVGWCSSCSLLRLPFQAIGNVTNAVGGMLGAIEPSVNGEQTPAETPHDDMAPETAPTGHPAYAQMGSLPQPRVLREAGVAAERDAAEPLEVAALETPSDNRSAATTDAP